jgi:hypothetical protein
VSKKNGKISNHKLCICRYCLQPYNNRKGKEDNFFMEIEEPAPIGHNKRDMKSHLKNCPHFESYQLECASASSASPTSMSVTVASVTSRSLIGQA